MLLNCQQGDQKWSYDGNEKETSEWGYNIYIMGYVLDMFGYDCLILFGYDVSLWEVMGHDLGDILACQIHGGHGGPHGALRLVSAGGFEGGTDTPVPGCIQVVLSDPRVTQGGHSVKNPVPPRLSQ